MSLLKIPFIFIAMAGLHVAASAPHSPPTALKEKKIKNTMENFLNQRSGPFIIKCICWSGAFAETGVIMANEAPLPRVSQNILEILVLRGSADRIHLSTLFVMGTISAGLGGFIRFQCYRELGRLFTFEVTIRENHRLITTGPYSFVRHPAYIGTLLTVAGVSCMNASPGSWLRECGPLDTMLGQVIVGLYIILTTLILAGLMMRMPKEDEVLFETFGKEWMEWKEKVPYGLIPGVY